MYAPPSGYQQPPAGYAPNSYAPNPYGPVPTPPAPPAASQNLVAAGATAALGGAAALIGFFLLPFYTISAGGNTLTAKGTDFTKDGHTLTGSSVNYQELWVVVAAAVAIVVLGAYLAYGIKTSGRGQVRNIGSALIAMGLIAVGILVFVYVDYSKKVQDVFNALGPSSATSGIAHGFGIGFWLSIAGMALAVIGGAIAMSKAKN